MGLLLQVQWIVLNLSRTLSLYSIDSLSQRVLFVCSLAAINFPHLMFIEICFYWSLGGESAAQTDHLCCHVQTPLANTPK